MAHVVRDYSPTDGYGLSVVFATNNQGRVEPFVFANRRDAERAADQIEDTGEVDTVLVWHGVELMDTPAAERFTFGVRGIA